jgi:hypothetical protein
MKRALFSSLCFLLLLPGFSQEDTASQAEKTKAAPQDKGIPLGDDDLMIKFVGSGNLQQTISADGPLEANTGLGVLFNRKYKEPKFATNLEFDLSINVASTADSIIGEFENGELSNRQLFGRYVLLPSNAKQAATFDFRLYLNPEKHALFRYANGLLFQFIGSNSNWKYDSLHSSAFGLSLKLGLFHDFVPDDIRLNKDYSVMAGVLLSYRAVKGDVSAVQSTDLRAKFLATSVTDFLGPEFFVRARFQNIRAEIQIPVLNSIAYNVPGLTNVQFVTTIAFVGGFPLDLSGK